MPGPCRSTGDVADAGATAMAACPWPRRSEEDVDLADRLVDVPGAGPAAREHRGVARPDLLRRAAVRGYRHPARQDVPDLVGLHLPVGPARRALPDPCLLAPVLPPAPPAALHPPAPPP